MAYETGSTPREEDPERRTREEAQRRRTDLLVYRVLRAEQRRDREEYETVPAAAVGDRRPFEARYLDALSQYGVAVLTDMLTTGKIFADLRKRWPVAYVAPIDDVQEFVRQWLALGWESFVAAVVADKWDPERSSLRTYFITLCKGRFSRHYRRWWRDHGVEIPVPLIDDNAVPPTGAEELDRLDVLGGLPRAVVVARVLERAPFTEIAENLDIPADAVRAIYRAAIRKLKDDDEGGSR